MNKFIKSLKYLSMVVALFLTGCAGYQNGTLMNPNYKTIAIAPVKNNTMEPLASTYLRKMLAEQFLMDGSLRVVDARDADCILYATIDDVETTGVGYESTANEDDYRPAEWSLAMKARFIVIVPGQSRPLVWNGQKRKTGRDEYDLARKVSGTARYAVAADQHAARRNGVEQLCLDVAEEIVEYTTEGW